MEPIPKSQLQSQIHRLGFVANTPETLDNLVSNPPLMVFIAPCRDTVPSPVGNAIYVLLEQLSKQLPCSSAIVARWPATGQPAICDSSKRTLYYRSPMRPTFLEKHLPYRLKMYVWGHELLHELKYARAAGHLSLQLGAKLVVVEDTPAFCRSVRPTVGRKIKILLHQHCDKPRVLRTRTWRKMTRAFDGMIFVAEQGRRITEQRHGTLTMPSFIIYSGVNLGHYSPTNWVQESSHIRTKLGIPSASRVLLYLGRLVPEKGIAEAAEAFNLACLQRTHMIIIGSHDANFCRDTSYLERLRRATSASNGRIHMIGGISQESVPPFYQTSDVVIVPSIGSEGLPKVIFEALAMGRPVIASDRGGMWELLNPKRNAWLLSDPANPYAIAETLKVVFQDTERINQMRQEIFSIDRPQMSEERMVADFAKTVGSFLGE